MFIYHPGTGTMISLDDPVFLIDETTVRDNAPDALAAFEDGYATHDDAALLGMRLTEDLVREALSR